MCLLRFELFDVRAEQDNAVFYDGRVYKFTSKLSPTQQFGYPIGSVEVTFTNAPGTYGTLEIDGENRADVDGYIGGVNLIDFASFSIFNPTRFRFTTAEGDFYIISQETAARLTSRMRLER